MMRTTNGNGEIAMVKEVEVTSGRGDDKTECDAGRV